MTTPAPTTLTELTTLIDTLRADLARHEDAATEIRATLATIRKQLAATGPRAGAKARSGRKRKGKDKALPFEQPAAATEVQ